MNIPTVMEPDFNKIEQRAWDVLRMNNRGTHTVPSSGHKNTKHEMYGHSWLWDGAAHAIGIAHRDPRFAATELDHILQAQWQNGMVPHMRFRDGSLDRYYWMAHILHPHSHDSIHGSGITQPPVLADAVQRVSRRMEGDDRRAFVDNALGRLIRYHEWIYAERDPAGDGGMVTLHPWEHGHDNSPRSIEPLREYENGTLGMAVRGLYSVIHLFRRDLKNAPAEQRASRDAARLMTQNFISLLVAGYDIDKIRGHIPLHEDVHMTSVLARNNQVLTELAHESGVTLPESLRENMARTIDNFESMRDPTTGLYLNKDSETGKLVPIVTSASLEPLAIADQLPPEHVDKLVQHLRDPKSFGLRYGLPSVPKDSPYYRQYEYWSGAAWTYPEWIIADGLERAGHHDVARDIAALSIKRASYSDFHEYASPETAEGCGAPNFSWTAAQTIDHIRRFYPESQAI